MPKRMQPRLGLRGYSVALCWPCRWAAFLRHPIVRSPQARPTTTCCRLWAC